MSHSDVLMSSPGHRIDLAGVPETMLWPLWNRAYDAKRRDRLIDDPLAVQLVEEIDYDFCKSFGPPNRSHAIRARVCDDLIRAFLEQEGNTACVVALGEGLDTAFWRLGEPDVPWISVDVPEAIETREQLLSTHPSIQSIARSALDLAWLDEVPAGCTPFVSAAGLFMYFQEADVRNLLTAIAERFSDAQLFFDAIPPFFSARTLKGLKLTPSYTAPKMPWGISIDDIESFLTSIGGIEAVRVQTYAEPFPRAMRPYAWLSSIAWLRRTLAPSLVHARTIAQAE